MKLIAAVLCLTAVNCSASDISGKWTGQGEWSYHGSGDHCYMSLSFEEGEDYLVRKGGYFDCSAVGMEIEPARYKKQGARLLDQDGEVIGSYENNVIRIKEPDTDNLEIFTTITISGLHFDYYEVWQKKDGTEIYNIRGRLFNSGDGILSSGAAIGSYTVA
ncbi:MAG: hypothetical protein WCW52_09470 [Elusimicrobiales bacterium]